MTIVIKKRFIGLLTRNFLLTMVTIVFFLFVPGCSNRHEKTGRPNIIVVLADDQGWGDMAYNGHPVLHTPNFDEMAAAGLRFDRFYAAAPVCSPTRGSIMTGRHPNRFGCFSWGFSLRPQEYTVAEALKKAGYATGHFGKWHLGPVRNGSPVNPGNSGFDTWVSSPNFFENNPILSHNGTAIQEHGESSMVTMDAALDFIEKYKNLQQPFFAYVCFGSPHQPHIASDEDRKLYNEEAGRLKNFYGEITGMDRAMGRLRKQLADWGIEKNTVLWYVSDNGGLPRLGSTGGRGYKGQIYEGGLRVPAIIQWPEQIPMHGVTNIPCNTYDIFPTLLEIAGIEDQPPHPLDGISLLPLIDDRMKEREKPMGFWRYTSAGKNDKPSIILIMADDMGYECLSCNGALSYNTPVLDKVAENGIRFTNCYAQPLCTPSRVKIMTGKYNSRNYIDFGILYPDEITFGNILKEAGYKTMVAGKWQLNGRDSQEPGYQDKNRPYHFGFDEYCLWQLTDKGSRYANPLIEQNGEVLQTTIDDYGPDIVSGYILDFIEKNKENPFFIYYPMILVHNPFSPTPDSPEWQQPGLRDKQDNKFFKDMVEYSDKIVGRIISKLEELDIIDNTILMFTGDNGTNTRIVTRTKEGNYKGGKGSLKDNGTNVPLVIQWPVTGKKGITTNSLVEFSDFVPTLAQAAGIRLNQPTDGISFLDLFTSPRFEARKSIFVHYYPRTRQVRGSNGCFARTLDYKLYSDGRFYNMAADKWEKNPLNTDSLKGMQQNEYMFLKKELDTKPIWNFEEVHRKN